MSNTGAIRSSQCANAVFVMRGPTRRMLSPYAERRGGAGPRMTKTAFAHWDDRIAPVFDIARRIHVVEADEGRIVAETGEVLADYLPTQKAHRLVELGVGTLVCGAISRPFHEMVAAYGIRVIPFVAGDLSEVIQ